MRFRWLSLFTLTLTVAWAIPAHLWAQTTNQAALVVRHGAGQVETRCVEFSEPQITGYDLLARAGFDVSVDAMGLGAAVCAINGTGCPANNCFCQCSGASCQYWSYWHQANGSWDYSMVGASSYPVTNGVVEGWSWGPGSVTQAIAPPLLTFEQICAAPVENTPPPTNTPPPPTPGSTSLPEPTVLFWLDSAVVSAGSCTTLHWDVQNVNALFLDNMGVQGQESRQLCPMQTQSYTLRAVYNGEEIIRQLTLEVIPSTATPTQSPSVTNPPSLLTSQPMATPSPQPSSTPPQPTATPPQPTATHNQLPTSSNPQPTLVVLLVPTITRSASNLHAIPAKVETTATTSPPATTYQPATPAKARTPTTNYILFSITVLGLSAAIIWRQRHS